MKEMELLLVLYWVERISRKASIKGMEKQWKKHADTIMH